MVTGSATTWWTASRSVPKSRKPTHSNWPSGPRGGDSWWRKVSGVFWSLICFEQRFGALLTSHPSPRAPVRHSGAGLDGGDGWGRKGERASPGSEEQPDQRGLWKGEELAERLVSQTDDGWIQGNQRGGRGFQEGSETLGQKAERGERVRTCRSDGLLISLYCWHLCFWGDVSPAGKRWNVRVKMGFVSYFSCSWRLPRSPTTWPAKRRSWRPPERPTARERRLWQLTSRKNSKRKWTSANRTRRRWERDRLQLYEACGIVTVTKVELE